MNFCVAILIVKMEEKMQHFWHILLYYFKKGKNAIKNTKKICAMCEEGAVTDPTCQRWFTKFHTGNFSLDDALWSGRPVEVDSDQMKTLIKKNQCSTTWEIVNILKVSKSIMLLVKMKNMPFILRKNLNGLFGQPHSFVKSVY